MNTPAAGSLHHVELWVPNIDRASAEWGWRSPSSAISRSRTGPADAARFDSTYIVVEQSPELAASEHDRKRPGLNHLAFHAGDRAGVDALAAAAPANGWTLLFTDKHPHAGGAHSYAAYLANTDGYEVELTANDL